MGLRGKWRGGGEVARSLMHREGVRCGDGAGMGQVGEVEGQLVVVSREKESIEALACDLILERDEATAEVEELKRVTLPLPPISHV